MDENNGENEGGGGERRVRNGGELKDSEKRKQWMKAKEKIKE